MVLLLDWYIFCFILVIDQFWLLPRRKNTVNAPHIAMPSPRKKRLNSRIVLFALGFGAILCCALLYSFYTLQGFHGSRIIDPKLDFFAARAGVVDLAVQEGRHVAAGDYLGSVEGAALRKQMAALEQRLAPLEMALPLEYGGYVGHSGHKDVVASSDEGLRRAEEKEKSAREHLNAVSLEETRAQVASRKAQQQFYKGAITEQALKTTQDRAKASKARVEEATRQFTEVSLARAALEKERNRIRFIQEESGLAAVPADVRVKEYEVLKAEHDTLKRLYAQSVFFAPSAAVVTAVQVENQSIVEQGQPILSLRPTHGFTLIVTSRVSGLASRALQTGDVCEVEIPSYGGDVLEGTITALVPVEGGWRSILPESMRWVTVYIDVPLPYQGHEGAPLASNASVTIRFVAKGLERGAGPLDAPSGSMSSGPMSSGLTPDGVLENHVSSSSDGT